MKVPTYTEQLQTKREVPGQRLSVQASPQQFSRVSDAAQKFYSQAEDAAFQYAQIEARQTNESQRLGALNESRRLLAESSEAAAEMARNDPDAAEQYMRESAELYREKFAKGIGNEATRQQFLLQYDSQANQIQAAVRGFTREIRAKNTTAAWAQRKIDLANEAANGNTAASLELFGNPEQGIKSHFDIGIESGAIAPDKAVVQADSTRTLVAKNRLITYMDRLQTIEQLEEFSKSLENGEVPAELSDDLGILLPSEVKQLKKTVLTEIKSEKSLKDAADALLSDEKRLAFEQFFNDPGNSLDEKKEKFLSLALGSPSEFGLIPSDFRATITHARANLSRAQSALSSENASIARGQKEILSIVTDGFDPGGEAVRALDTRIAKLGDSATKEVLDSQAEIRQTYSTLNEMRKLGPIALERRISEIEQESRGKVDASTAAIIKNGRTMLSKLNSRIQGGDAMGAAQDRGLIDMPPLTPDLYMIDENGMQAINPDFKEAIADRIQKAEFVAQQFGLASPQYLTDTEVQAYKERLKEGNYITRLAMLEAIVTGFGSSAPNVLGEIASDKEVGIYGHIGGLIVDGRTTAAEDALRGMVILEKGGPIEDLTPSFTSAAFNDVVGTAFNGLPLARGSLEKAALAIYAKRYGASTYDPSNFADAIQAAAGQSANGKGGIDDVNGAPTILPTNMDADQMEKALQTLTADDLGNQDVSGQEVDQNLLSDINKSDRYKVHPAPGTGRYYIYRGEMGIESSYQWMKDASGDPILIDFSALQELKGL